MTKRDKWDGGGVKREIDVTITQNLKVSIREISAMSTEVNFAIKCPCNPSLAKTRTIPNRILARAIKPAYKITRTNEDTLLPRI